MKGLSFIPDMAVAALEGRKTQTRRVIVPQPVFTNGGLGEMWRIECGDIAHYFFSETIAPDVVKRLSGYHAGEHRCLLTTWATNYKFNPMAPTEIVRWLAEPPAERDFKFWHAGMGPKPEGLGDNRAGRFLPNGLRHLMPVFEIVSVRAERVQSITEADARAEGASTPTGRLGSYPAPWATSKPGPLTYRDTFRRLWDSINAKRGPGKAKEGYGWKFNPWVWRVEFRRVAA